MSTRALTTPRTSESPASRLPPRHRKEVRTVKPFPGTREPTHLVEILLRHLCPSRNASLRYAKRSHDVSKAGLGFQPIEPADLSSGVHYLRLDRQHISVKAEPFALNPAMRETLMEPALDRAITSNRTDYLQSFPASGLHHSDAVFNETVCPADLDHVRVARAQEIDGHGSACRRQCIGFYLLSILR